MLIAGCEEENLSNTKKSRLIAAENLELKKELQQGDRQTEQQKELLEKCQQEKKALQYRLNKELKEQVEGVFSHVIKENQNLKARIKELETELEELKKQAVPQPL